MTNLKELEQKYAELGAEIERLKAGSEPKTGQVWVRDDDTSFYHGLPYLLTVDGYLVSLEDGNKWHRNRVPKGKNIRGFTLAADSVEEYYRDRT